MSSTLLTLIGGCHCGAIRYEAKVTKFGWIAYCHCRICQHTTGAPIVPFFHFSCASGESEFRYTKGKPAVYHSSDHGSRSFCDKCSTQLVFRDDQISEDVDIMTITLDDPNAIPPPTMHIYCESEVKWHQVEDGLPRYQITPREEERKKE